MVGPTATVRSTMAPRTIAQRELRNNVGAILREAQAGAEFTITVRGRPVARLGPADAPARRTDVDLPSVKALLAATPVDDAWAGDLALLRELELPAADPWPGS
jgi:prevent-host-death family protein